MGLLTPAPIRAGQIYETQAGEGMQTVLTIEQIGQIVHYNDGNDTTAKYRDIIAFIRQKTERTTKTCKEIRAAYTPPMQKNY